MNKIEKECTCDLKLDKCVSPVYIRGDMLHTDAKELMQCGKFDKLLKKCLKRKLT